MRRATALAEFVSTMARIDQGSRRSVDILGVIDGMACQTRLLALNAAVEAATLPASTVMARTALPR